MRLPIWSLLPLLGLVVSSTCDRPSTQFPSHTSTPALAPSVGQPAGISLTAGNSGDVRPNTVVELLDVLSTVELDEPVHTKTLWNSSWAATRTVASRNDVQIAGEPTSERTTTESVESTTESAESTTNSAGMPIVTPPLKIDLCWISKPCLEAISELGEAYDFAGTIIDPNEHDSSRDHGNRYFQIRFCSTEHYEE